MHNLENKKHSLNLLSDERGKRLRLLRETLRLSRKELGDKYQLSPATLQNWEDARYGGLTEKGAKKMTEVFQSEGIDCRLEWLFYGIGTAPVLAEFSGQLIEKTAMSEEAIIAQELRLFHQLNSNVIDAIVEDDALAPFLKPGDRVAGKRLFDFDIEKAIGQICIVQTLAGKMLIRLITKKEKEGGFLLEGTNQKISEKPIAIKVFSAAPVLWIRKREQLRS